MADISEAELRDEVKAVLKGADLQTVTSKAVRKQVEEKLGVNLTKRRKEFDAIIMAEIKDQVSSDEVSEEEVSVKRKKVDDDDYEPGASKKQAKKKAPKKRKAGSDDDSADEDWGKKKKKSGGGGKKGSGFTKSFKLSPELADLVGAEIMPRHEVVKKVWEVIKTRNLQDPSQKQFAICDDQLLKVIGIKRFRTFGMMKYLKNHFVEAV